MSARFREGAADDAVRTEREEQAGADSLESHPTDLGNAERLAKQFGSVIRWCEPWRTFLVWDGMRWARDETREPARFASNTTRTIYVEASAEADADRRKALAKHAVRSESEKAQRAMLELVKSRTGIAVVPADLDCDPWLLNCLNGTLDLRTGQLREHRPEDLITKLAPVAYNEEAPAPTFYNFIKAVTGEDQDLADFLQCAIGYAATGDTRERVVFVCWGTGWNGKSTLLSVIRKVLGDYALSTPPSTLLAKRDGSIPNDVARLAGSRFVTAVETGSGRKLDVEMVKQATGGDTMTARFMRAEWFDFEPTFKLFLASNHKPRITEQTKAIWERIRLITFTQRFVRPQDADASTLPDRIADLNLETKLLTEASGILRWIVEGCLRWQKEGLETPGAVRQATEACREEMDVLAELLDDRLIRDPKSWIAADQLYKTYKAWAEDRNEKPMSQTTLGRLLSERGFEKNRHMVNGYRCIRWGGLRLRTAADDSEQGEA